MDYTFVDYFNYYLKQFLNELVCTYPDFKKHILANYRPLLENKMDKSDLYAKYYYSKINKCLEQITNRDASLFTNQGVFLLEGIDFYYIWNSSQCNETNRTAIWKYLQILMIIGRRLIPDHREILQILNDISEGNISVPAQVEKTLESKDEEEKEEESGFGLSNLLGMASSLGGGNGLGGLGDIAGALGNMDIGKMMESMGGVLNQLSNVIPQPSTSTATTSQDEEASSESSTSNTENIETTSPSNPSATPSNTTTQPSNTNTASPAGLFGENSIFGELAKEMTETLNLEGLEEAQANGEQPNIGDVMKKVLTGDNPAKLMGLVGKFTSKLQNEISSGRINQADLLRQTMGMMSGMQQRGNGSANGGNKAEQNMAAAAEQLLNANPQLRARMQQAQRSNDTRARLAKKLADKKDSKQ